MYLRIWLEAWLHHASNQILR